MESFPGLVLPVAQERADSRVSLLYGGHIWALFGGGNEANARDRL